MRFRKIVDEGWEQVDRRALKEAILQLSLRMLPLVPGNEIVAVIRSVRRSQDDVDKQVKEAVDALSRSSVLIESLGTTLSEREKKLKELQAEYMAPLCEEIDG